jgi:hypothetical protein
MSQEANHIESTIADLRSWRDQIDAAIQTLEHLGAKGLALPLSAPPGVARPNGELPNDAFFQMTVPDAAEKYLKLAKATREISEIGDALLKGGLKSSSKNFNDMTRSVLSRDERFVKVPSGGWGLAEWYPAMRNRDRKAKTPAKPEPSAPITDTASTGIEKNLAPPKNPKKWTPTGNGRKVVILLAAHNDKTYSMKEVTSLIGSDRPASIASLLSEMAHLGRIGRGTPSGYQANAATNQAFVELGDISDEERNLVL